MGPSQMIPLDDGSFDLVSDGVMPFSTLLVEGKSIDNEQSSSSKSARTSVIKSTGNSSHSLALSSTPTSTPTPAPQFQSVMARHPPPLFNLKLVEA